MFGSELQLFKRIYSFRLGLVSRFNEFDTRVCEKDIEQAHTVSNTLNCYSYHWCDSPRLSSASLFLIPRSLVENDQHMI